jgi:hypothetical protein
LANVVHSGRDSQALCCPPVIFTRCDFAH